MQKKATNRPGIKKHTGRKKGLSRIVLILISVVIISAFLITNFTNFSTRKANKSSEIKTRATTIPFRKDGVLTILSKENGASISIDIEVADDEQERTRGLMDRFNLPENAGMLFIFPDEEFRSFWMKNTYISLDILYINAQMEIESIRKYTLPQNTSSIPSEKPAKYVLELNAGFTDKYNIKQGDRIQYLY